MVTLLPKEGDKNQPSNWRPISQTVRKNIRKKVLAYFLENRILTEFQFGFLTGKSTQESVFNTVRHMYSSINQNKVMGLIFLDVAKAFNCIDHGVLFKKMENVGMSYRVVQWSKNNA